MGSEEWGERNGERGMGREEWGERNGEGGMGREEWGERNGERGMGIAADQQPDAGLKRESP